MGEDKKTDATGKQLAVYMIFVLVAAVVLYYGANKLFSKQKASSTTNVQESTQIQYEQVELQAMLDELDANAMRAAQKYQDKHIEVTGKIKSFDSDGKYITIEPCDAIKLNLDTVHCSIESDAQKTFLLEKSVGDVVTIRGKVYSIGEVLGYSMEIVEIS